MSYLSTLAKDFLGRRGWYARRFSGMPAGVDLYIDLARMAPGGLGTVLDVGAHHGETAEALARHFPRAAIYSFEPVAANFARLAERARAWPNVTCVNAALGDSHGPVTIDLQRDSQTHSLRFRAGSGASAAGSSEEVRVMTVDGFARAEGIGRISLLKVDSEGYEVPILRGAAGALAEGRIDYLLLEASLDRGDTTHTAFREVEDLLLPLGYRTLALYDQVMSDAPRRLGYFNALFGRDTATGPGPAAP